ncbi:MAG: hypothetical protein ED859_03150 [Desulfuromonadales bacterium]|nr:MAG: hypothetical protein ED859_03150 [Desulfuromonadales bacterium]
MKRLEYKTTSGVILQSEPNKTVTILGSYRKDMHAVISELGDVKSLDFGPKTNGFNVLNVPDELYKTPEQFWTEYNKPWLDAAIERSDSIKLATKPEWQNLVKLNPTTNKLELTGYGKEISYLKKHRYAYDEITSSMILK